MAGSTGIILYPLNSLFPGDGSEEIDQSDPSFMKPTGPMTDSDSTLVVSTTIFVLMDS